MHCLLHIEMMCNELRIKRISNKRNDVINMKTRIDKSRVEYEFFRFMRSFTNEFDEHDANENVELMCDYVDVLRYRNDDLFNNYFDACKRNNVNTTFDERAFVVCECETQNEYIVIYNQKYNYVRNAFRVFE